jgi:hypothetical protein
MKIAFARHFLEFKHGIAAICVSGVPYTAPFSSLIDKNTHSLFSSAVLLNSSASVPFPLGL